MLASIPFLFSRTVQYSTVLYRTSYEPMTMAQGRLQLDTACKPTLTQTALRTPTIHLYRA